MIKAILFDLDNTLIDFLKMKRMAIEEAVEAMIDAGLKLDKKQAVELIYELYKEKLDSVLFSHPSIPLFYFGKSTIILSDLISYFYPEKRMK